MNTLLHNTYKEYPDETAARLLAHAQHAIGVTPRMNPRTFRVEYVRPDGSIVPSYDYYFRAVLKGEL